MSLSWAALAALRITVSDIIAAVLIKSTADRSERPRRLAIQYGILLLLGLASCIITGSETRVNWGLPLVLIAGIFNSLACYAQWRSVAISQSKTSLFSPGITVVSILLAIVFLDEGKQLNWLNWTGVAMLLTSAFVFASAKKESKKNPNKEFFLWMSIQVILFSSVIVFMKYSASVEQISRWSFSFRYYLGSAIGALGVIYFASSNERGSKLGLSGWRQTLPLAAAIYSAQILTYWTYELAPLSIVEPLFRASGLIFPFLIGQWYFGEKAHFNRREWIGCLIAFIGVVIIAATV